MGKYVVYVDTTNLTPTVADKKVAKMKQTCDDEKFFEPDDKVIYVPSDRDSIETVWEK